MQQMQQIVQSEEQKCVQEAQKLKQELLANPQQLEYVLHQNRELADLVLQDDIGPLVQFIKKQHQDMQMKRMKEATHMAQLEADPFNPEAQKQIEQIIHQKAIEENREMALEYVPELYSQITMLYIDIVLNNTPVQAFVDTGAQQTIISKACAERCGLTNKIDKRFSGIAFGVGTSKIIGKIHMFPIQVLDKKIPCQLTVLDDDKCDFLLGLDTLRRYQCLINLQDNTLSFKILDEMVVVKFLAEKDIHKTISIEAERLLMEQHQKQMEEESKANPNQAK